uniref:Uncharacterized protein n=1 Tax=viral metagenome TaxID=1070528 RepID=A0A6M3JGS3_9ZZZZ
MCLSELSYNLKEEFRGKTFGWKVFEKGPITKKLFPQIEGLQKVLQLNRWLDELDFRSNKQHKKLSTNNTNHPYPTGWHIFLTRKGARAWSRDCNGNVIRKVEFKEPVAYGFQYEYPIVVAKKILIVPNSRG